MIRRKKINAEDESKNEEESYLLELKPDKNNNVFTSKNSESYVSFNSTF